jgi:hypothetical protein
VKRKREMPMEIKSLDLGGIAVAAAAFPAFALPGSMSKRRALEGTIKLPVDQSEQLDRNVANAQGRRMARFWRVS